MGLRHRIENHSKVTRYQNVDDSTKEDIVSVEETATRSETLDTKDTIEENNNGKTDEDHKNLHIFHKSHKHKLSKKQRLAASKKFIFIIGAFVGIFSAWYFAKDQNMLPSSDYLNDSVLDFFDDMKDRFPYSGVFDDVKGLFPYSVVQEAQGTKEDKGTTSFATGHSLKEEGISAKFPVIMLPGVISTGLESWGLSGTPECPSENHFRKRLWGSWYMLKVMLLDKNCWLKHILLDPETGLDPEHFKVRAVQGLDAADFFMSGYWLWNKIIENLAAINYDSNTMTTASYDWRLTYMDLEVRDKFFSKLKFQIEERRMATGEKTVLIGHSMGSQIGFFFLKWVEAEGYGNGGPSWVNDNIESFVDISGSMLGTPKAVTGLLSGEMKDTIQLNTAAVYGLEKFFSRKERADMLRNWGGIASMLPKGGDAIWGNLEGAPDDILGQNTSFGNFIKFKESKTEYSRQNLTVRDSIEFLYSQTPEWFQKRVKKHYSTGIALTREEVERNNEDSSKWVNPVEAALPNAPDMKIYCLYGVGIETERSYFYRDENITSGLNVTVAMGDSDAIALGQGDGTVSLVSHTMCHRWKDPNSKFNPGGIPIKVVEMLDEPDKYDIRGGAKTAEHVDILGRSELNELILRIAAGRGDEIEEKIISNINDWVWDIDLGTN